MSSGLFASPHLPDLPRLVDRPMLAGHDKALARKHLNIKDDHQMSLDLDILGNDRAHLEFFPVMQKAMHVDVALDMDPRTQFHIVSQYIIGPAQ